MTTSERPEADNWKFVLDFVETLGKVIGVWIPGSLLITGATEAAGLLRRNVPRLIARLSEKPAPASHELKEGLRSVQIQLAEGDNISENLLRQVKEQAKQLAISGRHGRSAPGSLPSLDDLLSLFEISQSPDVKHLSLTLQTAACFRAFPTQWLPPNTLLLGGGFRGEIKLTRLLSGEGWRRELRQRLGNLTRIDNDGVSLDLLPDRGKFEGDRGSSLELHSMNQRISVLDDDQSVVCSVIPVELPDPVQLLVGASDFKIPRGAVKGWAVRICAASNSKDALTIYYLTPQHV